MFAIKEAQECVISEYLCESDWRRNSLIPSACLKTPQHIFQLAVKVDIQSARQEEKKEKRKDNVPSVQGSYSLGNIIISCCQAKPLFQSYVLRQ